MDDFAKVVTDFQAKMADLTRIQEERTQLVGVGTASRRRVRVTVNADGIAVDITFAGDIGALGFAEIAAAVTEASRAAVLDVAGKSTALMGATILEQQAPPPMDDLLATIRGLRDQLG